ncbi:MAG: hypothetical protein VX252_17115 [Myxococcota bacterium]|nr:hypothetical protein [Myxococcota bacterium]
MVGSFLSNRGAIWTASLALGLLGLLTLIAVGQPIITDDTWIHLTLGRAYFEQGPWLEADPLLADALGPPLPAAWLTGAFLHGIERVAGFGGLRVFHVLIVAVIGILAFSILKRASQSIPLACLGTGLFIALSGYRLIQLRPHLFTLLASLLLYRLLIEPEKPPSRARIIGSIALLALWANLHASFLLGPILLGAALGGLVVAMLIEASEKRQAWRARVWPIALVFVLGGLATLINPTGFEQHLAYLAAGAETPTLDRVADEWTRFNPFGLPPARVPPSPLVWALLWLFIVITPVLALLAVRKPEAPSPFSWNRENVDPALIGIALLFLIGALSAVRFTWLGFFPLLVLLTYIGQAFRAHPARQSSREWVAAAGSVLLLPLFLAQGPWPMMSGMLPTSTAAYALPYPTAKYHGGAIFFLADSDVEGKLFADYYLSGFSGYWLSPRVQSFVNGTLNVSPDIINANRPIRERRGERDGESFTELLDRHEIDLFLGTRLPRTPPSGRPWYSTTGHLNNTEGWIEIYRNLAGALYLRDLPRNQESLAQIANYYQERGVPFDPDVGFEALRVIAENPQWAIFHGLIPSYFDQAVRASTGLEPTRRNAGMEVMARYYTALGEHAAAIRLDTRLARLLKEPDPARRRQVYNLLHAGQWDEATAAAEEILADPSAGALSTHLAERALEIASGQRPEFEIHGLAVFTPSEAAAMGQEVPIFVPPRHKNWKPITKTDRPAP